jgi:maleamate amidohydrolase
VIVATGHAENAAEVYRRQGFGHRLAIQGQLALLIVDFVVGFADPGAFGGGNIGDAIAATAEVLAEARRRAWPVAHTRIVFADDGSDANVFCQKVPMILHLTEDAPGSAIVPSLRPLPGELIVRKKLPSAFFDTDLRSWLTRHQVATLLIAGTTTSGCVRASVVDAMSCGFRPIVLSDCVGDRAASPHQASLFDMEQKYAEVMTFSSVLAEISREDMATGSDG